MIDRKKIDKKQKEEETARQKTINSEWEMFSKTHAYKDLIDYMESQKAMLLNYAENLQMPGPDGKMVMIDGPISNLLLQNRRGVNIVSTYIKLRSE